jgi:RNA polymerase sigma factor (sigma-70 family)
MNLKRSAQERTQKEQIEKLSLYEEATRQVFERYISQLKSLIRWKLNERIRRKEGTSDIVQAIFKSFFESNPDLTDPDNLLGVLLTFTNRKIINTVHKHQAAKRDYRRDQFELKGNDSELYLPDLEKMALGPSSEEVIMIIDLVEHLKEKEQRVLKLLLEGYSHKEASREIGCSEKTVQRIVIKIRERWKTLTDV